MYHVGNLVKELTEKHGRARESLMPVLQGIVSKHNYLTDEAMVEVAKELDISAAEVYGTASFYTFLDTSPRGKYIIRVCKTITCSMKGKNDILHTIESAYRRALFGNENKSTVSKILETISDRQNNYPHIMGQGGGKKGINPLKPSTW